MKVGLLTCADSKRRPQSIKQKSTVATDSDETEKIKGFR